MSRNLERSKILPGRDWISTYGRPHGISFTDILPGV
jgi:hypothetical protein